MSDELISPPSQSDLVQKLRPDELFNSDAQGYSDEDEEDDGEPITLGIRQPSFSRLTGKPIPKGGEIEDLGAITEDNGGEVAKGGEQNKMIVNHSETAPVHTEPVKQINAPIPQSDSMFMLRSRNQDKWKEIGYDPNHGKGDMRGSITLSNFQPLSLLKDAPINLSNSSSMVDNVFEAELNKSSGSFTRVPKPNQVRVNSSDGPRAPRTVISSDENEDEDETNNESIIQPKSVASLLGLYNNEDNLESETSDNLSATSSKLPYKAYKPNRRQIDQPRKPYKFQHDVPSFIERNNMFLTQVEEEVKLARLDRDNEPITPFQPVFNEARCKEIASCYKKPKIIQPHILFPTYKPPPRIDLSKYDKSSDEFDGEVESSKIPPRLLELITHSKQSLVFQTLCGESIVEYPKKVINQVIQDLKKYVDLCVSKNMIGETSYVQCRIDNTKLELQCYNQPAEIGTQKIEEKIEHVTDQLEQRKYHWSEQKEILKCEKELALQDLEIKYQEEAAHLEDEWNTPKVQQRYNKPSAKLIEMRQHASALIAVHNFEEANDLALAIQKQEVEETRQAAEKMTRDFIQAQEALKKKFKTDSETLAESFDSKTNGIIASEIADLRPFEQRIDNMRRMKINQEIAQKRNAREKPVMKQSVPIQCNNPPISLNAKLKLPPLRPSRLSTATKV